MEIKSIIYLFLLGLANQNKCQSFSTPKSSSSFNNFRQSQYYLVRKEISCTGIQNNHYHYRHYHQNKVKSGPLFIESKQTCITSTSVKMMNREQERDREQDDMDQNINKKRIIFIRHGRTYMNEYLSTPGSQWGEEGFTDTNLPNDLYRDSPLSSKGIEQATKLLDCFTGHHDNDNDNGDGDGDGGKEENNLIRVKDIDIIVVSPLTRALQTFEIGVLPHFLVKNNQDGIDQNNDNKRGRNHPPIITQPLASERVFLVSDLGLSTKELEKKFPFADFTSEFHQFEEEEWWFTVKPSSSISSTEKDDQKEQLLQCTKSKNKQNIHPFTSIKESEYIEWRPNSNGQIYACLGEPDDQFNARMKAFYDWLYQREENVICVVAHWGVLHWLIGLEFENCEMKDVPFEDVKYHVDNNS